MIFSLLSCHLLTKPERERVRVRLSKGYKGELRMSSLMEDALTSAQYCTLLFKFKLLRLSFSVCVCEGRAMASPFCSVYCWQWGWTPLKIQDKSKEVLRGRKQLTTSLAFPLAHTRTHKNTHSANYMCHYYVCSALIVGRSGCGYK